MWTTKEPQRQPFPGLSDYYWHRFWSGAEWMTEVVELTEDGLFYRSGCELDFSFEDLGGEFWSEPIAQPPENAPTRSDGSENL